jgi:hypothetical protein
MDTKDTNTICPFSLKEKLYAQIAFNSGIITGAYGLFMNSTALGITYLLYVYIGIILLMRYTVCLSVLIYLLLMIVFNYSHLLQN